MSDEVPLSGGNVSAVVVRVGQTVRKPWTPATPSVDHLLAYLAESGFDGSPEPLGRDAQGRHVLEYIPGDTATTSPPWTWTACFAWVRLFGGYTT